MTSVTFIQTYLYPTVFVMVAAWIVSRAGSVLIKTRLSGLWDRLPGRNRRTGKRKFYKEPTELLRSIREDNAGTTPRAKMIEAILNEGLASTGKAAPQCDVSTQMDTCCKSDLQGGLSYRERFLVNDGVCSRVSTYINRDTHEKIKKLLSAAAPGISIVSYINNILNHHLDQHQELLDDMFHRGLNSPFQS